MRVFTGDENGLFKEIDLEKKAVAQVTGFIDRNLEIKHMCWAANETEVAVSRTGGFVDVLRTDNGQIVQHFDGFTGAFAGILSHENHIVTAMDNGRVIFKSRSDSVDGLAESDSKNFQVKLDAGSSILRMRANKLNKAQFATGGKEHDLHVWDMTSPVHSEPIFQSKNVKNTKLDLRVPVHITDIAFLNAEGTKLVTGTALHQIRVYDTKAGRRPVMNLDFGEHPIKSLAVTNDNLSVLLSDSIGGIASIDLRRGLQTGAFKGIAGAVQDLGIHPTLNFVASVGLDRHLRVHDIESRKLLSKVYIKQRTNCLLFSADLPANSSSSSAEVTENTDATHEEPNNDDNVDNDQLWDQIPDISKGSSTKPVKRKTSAASSTKQKRTKDKK